MRVLVACDLGCYQDVVQEPIKVSGVCLSVQSLPKPWPLQDRSLFVAGRVRGWGVG